jgi:hypothetical protein
MELAGQTLFCEFGPCESRRRLRRRDCDGPCRQVIAAAHDEVAGIDSGRDFAPARS